MGRIGVVGSSNVDLTFRVSRLPGPGETLAGSDLTVGFGGKGANQAVTAARLGAEVVFVSCVGADDFGERMLAQYREEGIDTTFVRVVPGVPSGSACILVDDRAQNSIIVVAGANGRLGVPDVTVAGEALRSVRVVLAQLETPIEATMAAFRLARAAGVTTILNPAPAAPLPDKIYPLTDLCVPNETEATALTGQSPEKAADVLLERGSGAVIVTRGARGVLVVDRGGREELAAVPVKAIDTTGAGDAFLGALAAYLADGDDRGRAIRRAMVVAALSVTRSGAQASFPTQAEVKAFRDSVR
jgi:ribokinase